MADDSVCALKALDHRSADGAMSAEVEKSDRQSLSLPFGLTSEVAAAVIPVSVRDMAKVIGLEAAVKLHEHYRGLDGIYLRDILGDPDRKSSGVVHTAPINPRKVFSYVQQTAILECGLPTAEAAAKFGVTPQWVRRLRRMHGPDRCVSPPERPKSFVTQIAERLKDVELLKAAMLESICQEVGCKPSYVRSVAKKLGVAVRVRSKTSNG